MPKKLLKGEVVSDKMDKTIVVKVIGSNPHRRYKKFVTTTKKFKAHDEKEECNIGDIVEIIENPPISKTKKWVLNKIIQKAE